MLVSGKNYPKKKLPTRRDDGRRNVKGRRWAGKPSILENQNVSRRHKKNVWSDRLNQNASARDKQAADWGLDDQSGEWRTRFLEGGFILASGLSNVVRNGMDYLSDWVKGGRETEEQVAIPPLEFGQEGQERVFLPERVEPEVESEYNEGVEVTWPSGRSDVVLTQEVCGEYDREIPSDAERAVSPPDQLRDNIEWNKINAQDQEELGLGPDELEDQAGALRSMFSNNKFGS